MQVVESRGNKGWGSGMAHTRRHSVLRCFPAWGVHTAHLCTAFVYWPVSGLGPLGPLLGLGCVCVCERCVTCQSHGAACTYTCPCTTSSGVFFPFAFSRAVCKTMLLSVYPKTQLCGSPLNIITSTTTDFNSTLKIFGTGQDGAWVRLSKCQSSVQEV